jgi:hypothetical protein
MAGFMGRGGRGYLINSNLGKSLKIQKIFSLKLYKKFLNKKKQTT